MTSCDVQIDSSVKWCMPCESLNLFQWISPGHKALTLVIFKLLRYVILSVFKTKVAFASTCDGYPVVLRRNRYVSEETFYFLHRFLGFSKWKTRELEITKTMAKELEAVFLLWKLWNWNRIPRPKVDLNCTKDWFFLVISASVTNALMGDIYYKKRLWKK